ncbi:MAG: family 16 glycosylhydrolase [Lacibacter sp.]|jgi:beta-glucanase (GH16 family)
MNVLIQGFVSLLALWMVGCTEKKEAPTTTRQPVIDRNWQFETTPVWADEFNSGTQPDLTKWSFDTGGGGWGNNELQYYTNGANATVTGGNLVLTARRETVGSNQYTSARLVSRGKGDWLYGKFEIRARLPRGRGTWPAIWMLPTDNHYGNWPASGEIDIMEHVGYDPNRIHFSVHTAAFNHLQNTQRSASVVQANATDDFNVYSCEWTPFAVRGFINGVKYFEFTNANTGFAAWPFDRRFHIILNIAVGGNWGGVQGVDDTAFPTTMLIDYVRVYRMINQ